MSTISASTTTTTAYTVTADTTGALVLQTGATPTTAVTIGTDQSVSIPKGVGGTPTFSYYQSVAQTLASATFTKITFTTSEFDTTAGMYASSRFTPTIAGYYQVSGALAVVTTATAIFFYMYKNGALYKNMGGVGGTTGAASGSALVYLNGSTDYIELYGYFGTGQNTNAILYATYFQAAMIRGA
jgi:hypothetical protein